MKRLLLAVAVIAVLIGSVMIVTAAENRIADRTGTLTINVPTNWIVDESDEGSNLAMNRAVNGVVRSNFNIGEEEVGGKTLDQYEKESRKTIGVQIKGAKVVSRAKTKIGGLAAYQWVFTAKIDGKPFKFKSVFTVKDGKAYIFTYATLNSTYQKDVAGFDAAVKSVKWN